MISRKKVGAINVIEVGLPLNEELLDKFHEVADECLDCSTGQIVVDLEKVPLLDSLALESFLDLQDECMRRGGALTLAGPSKICSDVLRITHLDRMIDVFPSVLLATGSYTE